MKRLALISVTDKTGIVEFAKGLLRKDFEILSTGGTAEHLRENGVDVVSVSYYTGMPEILGGRVKTLHPKIHGGLLGNPNDPKHVEEMQELDMRPIEVLAVNLYPFENTVLGGADEEEAIENIDIGGPAMLRAAAKNASLVFVIVDPQDYEIVLKNIGETNLELRKKLQAKAFAHTAFYDSLIAEFLGAAMPDKTGETLTLGLRLREKLRYGENPHQRAGVLVRPFASPGVPNAKQAWGKELSYNNILDADAAWELACDLAQPGARQCVIVKHGNPCGAAWGPEAAASFTMAKAADPISAFGGIIALPGELDEITAETMAQKGNFFEVILCNSITAPALHIFKNRSGWGQDVRILEMPARENKGYLSVRTIRGGALVQDADTDDPVEWHNVTLKRPTEEQTKDLRSAWTIVKHVKSNAIAIVADARLLGVGAGQMNRVQSVALAIEAAGEFVKGAVLASDAFFPFPDSIEVAAKAGIAAIVQPGGSKKDSEVIAAANKLGVAMVFTGVRHFRH